MTTKIPPNSNALLQCNLSTPLLLQEVESISSSAWIWLGWVPVNALINSGHRTQVAWKLFFSRLLETNHHVTSVTLWDHHAVRSPSHTETPGSWNAIWKEKERPKDTAALLELDHPALTVPLDTKWVRYKPSSWVLPNFLIHTIVSKIKWLFYITKF